MLAICRDGTDTPARSEARRATPSPETAAPPSEVCNDGAQTRRQYKDQIAKRQQTAVKEQHHAERNEEGAERQQKQTDLCREQDISNDCNASRLGASTLLIREDHCGAGVRERKREFFSKTPTF